MKDSETVISYMLESPSTLNHRLGAIHRKLIQSYPLIERIACAIYDPAEDLLSTFINSTRSGKTLQNYSFKLSESHSLKQLAEERSVRVIQSFKAFGTPHNVHQQWLLDEGYQSSFTVPLYCGERFVGFVFFDARVENAFDAGVQRDLVMYANLINMSICGELNAVRSIIASTRLAMEFTQLRDFETGAHLERISRYSREIAKAVAKQYHLNDEFIQHVFHFSPLHDIGKIGVPDSILLKPSGLTPDERQIMQSHVIKGEQMMAKIIAEFDLRDMPDSKIMFNIVACHHEMMDGSGYPRQLKGDDIPIEARIVTVADIFDALSTARPYKAAWPLERVLEELRKMAELNKLDRNCVMAVINNIDEFIRIKEEHQEVA